MPTKNSAIEDIFTIDFQWPTIDPFLFCVHHKDFYPKGNAALAPEASLAGRKIGQDFELKDGFRMYHGSTVPGFPVHPHRGFETVTIVLQGFVDHADSLGAAGRYGNGDVQWMTAGGGVQHAEMFPLLDQEQGNTLELFQIWLNLPQKNKLAQPHFTMFWNEKIPLVESLDKKVKVRVIAGSFGQQKPLPPPPHSWAHEAKHRVAIWLIEMLPGASLELPLEDKAQGEVQRLIYFYDGQGLEVNAQMIQERHGVRLKAGEKTVLAAKDRVKLLLLQGQAIAEPVAQYGPFVMNTQEELQKAFRDFQSTEFGGWKWGRPDPTHGPKKERFARYPDGKMEKPG